MLIKYIRSQGNNLLWNNKIPRLLESMPGIPFHSGKAQEPTSTDQDWVQRNHGICSKRGNFCGLQLYFSQCFGPELSAHPGCCSVWTRAAFPTLHVCIAWMETLKEQQLQQKWKGCTAWNSSDLWKTNLPKWARLQLKKKLISLAFP